MYYPDFLYFWLQPTLIKYLIFPEGLFFGTEDHKITKVTKVSKPGIRIPASFVNPDLGIYVSGLTESDFGLFSAKFIELLAIFNFVDRILLLFH